MTQTFILPWQQICRIYPIKEHSFIYIIFCLYCNSILFSPLWLSSTGWQIGRKNYRLRKNALPWKQNCLLYWNIMWFWLILTMKGKMFIIWLVLMCYLSSIWHAWKATFTSLSFVLPCHQNTHINTITKTDKTRILGSAVAQWWAHWPLELEVQG